jgi:S-sulfosulfanyl-L-cysteine sulfohydrolase
MFTTTAVLLSLAAVLSVTATEIAPGAETSEKRVSLVWVHDIHAQLEPHAELFWEGDHEEFVENVGGLARMATVFEALRAERGHELLFIDGGDTIQGSGPAAWTQGAVVIEPMNALGFDLAVPGNWSVAYGADLMKKRAAEFKHPVIAANVFDGATGELRFKPYMIREVNGLRVGIIGFTEPDIPTRQPPHMSDGLSFKGAEVLPPLVKDLRENHSVDVVILATHIGLPKATHLADTIEGVDVVLSSDTHERTYDPIVRGNTWVVEAGAFASFVGVLDLVVSDGEIVKRKWRLIELRPELFPENPEVKQVVEASLAPHRARMNEVIGYAETWLARYEVVNTSLDNLIAHAIRESTGADVGLSNGYRFSPPKAPGPITEADLWTWLPVPLRLKTGQATGAQLNDYWERELEHVFSDNLNQRFGGWLPRTGLSVAFEMNGPNGSRVSGIAVGDEPLDHEKTYTLAAGDRKGSPEGMVHRVSGCTFIRTTAKTTHDAVTEYLRRHSPIRSEGERNLRCLDCSGSLRSQFPPKLAIN